MSYTLLKPNSDIKKLKEWAKGLKLKSLECILDSTQVSEIYPTLGVNREHQVSNVPQNIDKIIKAMIYKQLGQDMIYEVRIIDHAFNSDQNYFTTDEHEDNNPYTFLFYLDRFNVVETFYFCRPNGQDQCIDSNGLLWGQGYSLGFGGTKLEDMPLHNIVIAKKRRNEPAKRKIMSIFVGEPQK